MARALCALARVYALSADFWCTQNAPRVNASSAVFGAVFDDMVVHIVIKGHI